MLSLLLDQKSLNKAKKELTAEQDAYYRGLFKEGKIRVFYSFDGQSLTFVAYVGKDYGKCVFRFDGQCEVFQTPLTYALLLFVRKMDEASNEEENRARYGSDYETLRRYIELGPQKAKLFYEATSRIDELASRVASAHRNDSSSMPQIQFVIDPGPRDGALVSIKIGFSKLYLNRKVGAFIRDYYAGRPVQIQKEYATLKKHGFDGSTEAALQFLYNVCASSVYFNTASAPSLEEAEMVDLLFLLSGKTVSFYGQNFLVGEPTKTELSLGEDGSLSSSIPTDAKGIIVGQGRAIWPTKGVLKLYEFASVSAGEVYRFYQELGGLEGGFVAEQMARKVLPILREDEVSVNEQFAKEHPILRPRIDFYIGLEEGKKLTFETKLFVGEEPVNDARFVELNETAARRLASFKEELSRLGLLENGNVQGDDNIVSFLSADLVMLEQYARVFVSEELQSIHVASAPSIGLRTTSGEDWFSVNLYSSGYTEDELIALFQAYRRKKKFVRLSSNRFVSLTDDNPDLKRLEEAFDPASIGVELPLYQALKLTGFDAENDAKVKDLIQNVQNFSARKIPYLPTPIEEQARPYQRQGIQFLYNLYCLKMSGILSDDMGLGKTLQAFGVLSLVQEDKPILIVCPKSLIYNWMDERQKWYPELPSFVLVGTPDERKALYRSMKKQGKACYFVSYDTLRNDIDEIKDVSFSVVMLDEGQYIANANALKTRAVKRLDAQSRFVLTGTPVQNSLTDLWSLFDFLLPGYFPPLVRFRDIYGGLELSSDEARQRLLAKIKPFLLGRKKKDVLTELPDKENITISLSMGDDQRKVYESYLAKARELINDDSPSKKMNLLAMMTRLRQICINPALFLEGEYSSAKIDHLIETLQSLKEAGRKAIVFSSFVGALEIIGQRCKEAGLATESILGSTSAKVRVLLAERFNKPDSAIDVMLVSLKAGGTGLNLIGADVVFHLDPWWNLAAERQAEDRAHRIGQKNKVTVFKLVIKDSVEEKVLSLQDRKGLLVDLTDEASLDQALTEEDYRFLLS